MGAARPSAGPAVEPIASESFLGLSVIMLEAINAWDSFRVDKLCTDIERIVVFGPRSRRDVEALKKTVDYLGQELTASGYVVEVDRFGDAPGDCNVIAARETLDTQLDAGVLEVCAHFDTVEGSPGADDNASGLAGLLAVARCLSAFPDVPVRFCAFGREETGMDGSRHHQGRLDREGAKLFGAIVFEMIGYTSNEPESQRTPLRVPGLIWPPRSGNFVALISNLNSGGVAKAYQEAWRSTCLRLYSVNKILGAILKDAARSDHVSYWRCGRAAIMLTDTANFRNPHYHRPSDTIDTIDFELISQVARATTELALARYRPK